MLTDIRSQYRHLVGCPWKVMLNKIKRLTQSALLKTTWFMWWARWPPKPCRFCYCLFDTGPGTTGFGDLSYYLSLDGVYFNRHESVAKWRFDPLVYVYGRHGLGNILLAGGLYSVGVLLIGTVISWLLHSELLFTAFYCLLQTLIQNQLALRQCQNARLAIWPSNWA